MKGGKKGRKMKRSYEVVVTVSRVNYKKLVKTAKAWQMTPEQWLSEILEDLAKRSHK